MRVAENRVSAHDPDFLCIGQQKAGTGWLYDQLTFHQDFWMPPIKELHYMDAQLGLRPDVQKLHRRLHADLQKSETGRVARNKRPFTQRDIDFLDKALPMVGAPTDLDRYADLFAVKDGLISGDITPAYSTLQQDVIDRIATRFRNLKIILLVRNPVERAWSSLNMQVRLVPEAQGDAPLRDWVSVKAKIAVPDVVARSFPSQIWRRWRGVFPPERIRYFFFDDVVDRPAEVRADILRFLGADPEKPSGHLPPGFNRKAARSKVDMSDEIRQKLIGFYRDELLACAATFGGRAETWAAMCGPDHA